MGTDSPCGIGVGCSFSVLLRATGGFVTLISNGGIQDLSPDEWTKTGLHVIFSRFTADRISKPIVVGFE